MSSNALGQFREEFGCWVTDHGMTSIGRTNRDGVWICTLDLPALEKAIGELIDEAAKQASDVAADLFLSAPEPAQVPLPAVLRQVLGDLQRRVASLEAARSLLPQPFTLPDTITLAAGTTYERRDLMAAETEQALSCGCRVVLQARMAAGREVLCSEHGPAVISQPDPSMMGPVL